MLYYCIFLHAAAIILGWVESFSLSALVNRQRDVNRGQIGDYRWHQQICGCDYKNHRQPVCCTGLEFHCHIYINPASQYKWQCLLNTETARMVPQREQQTSQTDIWEAESKTRPGTHTAFKRAVNVTGPCLSLLTLNRNLLKGRSIKYGISVQFVFKRSKRAHYVGSALFWILERDVSHACLSHNLMSTGLKDQRLT